MEINPMTVNTTAEMELCVLAIDASLSQLWRQDPARGLDAADFRTRVADLEMLLPEIAKHADIFFHSDFREEDYFEELYLGFALWALRVMLDARALWSAGTVANFLAELERASATVHELRKYATVEVPGTTIVFADPIEDVNDNRDD